MVEPTDQKVAEGAPAVLDCIAAGNPTPTLFWMKESDSNILLPGSTSSHVTVTPEGTLRIGKQTNQQSREYGKLFFNVSTCVKLALCKETWVYCFLFLLHIQPWWLSGLMYSEF